MAATHSITTHPHLTVRAIPNVLRSNAETMDAAVSAASVPMEWCVKQACVRVKQSASRIARLKAAETMAVAARAGPVVTALTASMEPARSRPARPSVQGRNAAMMGAVAHVAHALGTHPVSKGSAFVSPVARERNAAVTGAPARVARVQRMRPVLKACVSAFPIARIRRAVTMVAVVPVETAGARFKKSSCGA